MLGLSKMKSVGMLLVVGLGLATGCGETGDGDPMPGKMSDTGGSGGGATTPDATTCTGRVTFVALDTSGNIVGGTSDGKAQFVPFGSGDAPAPTWATGTSQADATLPGADAALQFPDLDGDGRADFCRLVVEDIKTQIVTLKCDLANGKVSVFDVGTIVGLQANSISYLPSAVCALGSAGVWCASWAAGAQPGGVFTNVVPSFGSYDGGDITSLWPNEAAYWGTSAYPDVNGDGKPDFCGRGPTGVGCALDVAGGGAGTFSLWTPGMFTDAQSWDQAPYYQTIYYPDVDGDGAADLCGRGSGGIVCSLSNKQNLFGPQTLMTANFDDAIENWNSNPAYYDTIQFPDVNGDGRADVCGRGSGGVKCALSTGVGFTPISTWSADFSDANGWNQPALYGTIQYPDINGDGKADLCALASDGLHCALSNGSSFGAPALWDVGFIGDAGQKTTTNLRWQSLQFPVLNHCGKLPLATPRYSPDERYGL
jgi:hypothetical protein